MSSGTRRLNYTKRQKIKREHAVITTTPSDDGAPLIFNASLELKSYTLPPDARVFVEAYRQTAWQRFDFGTFAQLQSPESRLLTDFGAGEGVQFRVKVVESSTATGPTARILARADGIAPNVEGRRRSLLALDPDPSMRDEVWRLEIDDDTGPLVKVSSHLVRDRHDLARSSEFVSIALPEILRRVLSAALNNGLPDAEDDWERWRGQWLRMACSIVGRTEPPQELDDDENERERWIDSVVTRFCRVHQVPKELAKWRSGGGAV